VQRIWPQDCTQLGYDFITTSDESAVLGH